jgi:hypothetical protein
LVAFGILIDAIAKDSSSLLTPIALARPKLHIIAQIRGNSVGIAMSGGRPTCF